MGDANDDWETAAPTVADDPVTAPHDVMALPGYEIGRLQGRTEGWNEAHEDAMIELKAELLARGLEGHIADHIVLAVRQRLMPL